MKHRGVLVLTAAFLAVGAWLAWRPAPPPGNGARAISSAPGTPAVTQTGAVIPSLSMASSGGNAPSDPAPGSIAGTSPGRHTPAPAPSAATPADASFLLANSPARAAAMVELDRVHHMITDYHTLMRENPVGTNAEIMKALMGGNPHQATLGPPEGQVLNDKGELVDPWGTPYFFHQLSRDHMEIHSAGPDRIMGTADDLVVE